MNDILTIFNTSHLADVATHIAVWWVFAAFVGGMPKPAEDSFWYGWFYRSLHLLSANLEKARNPNKE